MPLPVRSLPVVQKWSCHGCSDCCRTYHVRVTDAERDRIAKMDWSGDPAMAGVDVTVYDKKARDYRLNHQDDGVCVLLDAENRCRIHAKYGEPAKPMACRLYPFVLVPAGDHWRVGLRFACPTVTKNEGKPVAERTGELREYAGLLEADASVPPGDVPAPPLQGSQAVSWPDLLRFTKAVVALLAVPGRPIERKLRAVLSFDQVCRHARYDKVQGKRLGELFEVLTVAVGDETPADPYAVRKPGWVGRMTFRQVAALYCRKDSGRNKGSVAGRGRFALAAAAWRFARGTGIVPRLHGLMPEGIPFATADKPFGPLPDASEALLTRYYVSKVESMQFCGSTNFHQGFWDGLEMLVLTFPVVMFIARVMVAGGKPKDEAVSDALRIVDDNFGFNPLFGKGRQVWALRMLAAKGELPRLVAWYGR
ncbi:MAG TPA: YkgJ family cysteine cluster protein [Fimbriiglobus sp.]|jgi:lysine-N-methylase